MITANYRLIVRTRANRSILICVGSTLLEVRHQMDYALQDYDDSDESQWWGASFQSWFEPQWVTVADARGAVKKAMKRNRQFASVSPVTYESTEAERH